MNKPSVLVLRTAGTNCDKETAFAFKESGAEVELVHINSLIEKKNQLEACQILAIPGGFSYGDDAGAGRILANELRFKLEQDLKKFISAGKLIIGICNGFQILVKAGLLPGNNDFSQSFDKLRIDPERSRRGQEATLTLNDSAKFEDRWVYLKSPKTIDNRLKIKCVWTQNLPEIIYLPVAHGEGKFVCKDDTVLKRLKESQQIVFQYCDEKAKKSGYPVNPNGSVEDIAGICDNTGRILGLMPHPERHFLKEQHPRWTRNHKAKFGDGSLIFKNGVEYVRKNL